MTEAFTQRQFERQKAKIAGISPDLFCYCDHSLAIKTRRAVVASFPLLLFVLFGTAVSMKAALPNTHPSDHRMTLMRSSWKK